jgi:hypothetical protein
LSKINQSQDSKAEMRLKYYSIMISRIPSASTHIFQIERYISH